MKTVSITLISLISLSLSVAYANNVDISAMNNHLSIGRYLKYLEDPHHSLSFDQVKQFDRESSHQWIKSNKDYIGFGFTSSAYWVKFIVQNRSDKSVNWFLTQEYPLIDHLDIYILENDGTYELIKTGDYLPFSKRPYNYRYFVFPISAKPHSTNTLFIRFKTTSSMNMSLKAWRTDSFLLHRDKELPFLWLFYGMFLIMFIYNLFVLINTKDITYFYYILYIACFTLLMMSLNGIAFQYLWPKGIWWANICNPILISLTIFAIIEFAISFVGIDRSTPAIYWTLKICSYTSIVICILTIFLGNYRIGIITAAALTGVISALGLVFAVYLSFHPKHKNDNARFFLFAFSFFLLGIITFVLKTFSFLPTNFLTIYSIQITAVLEIALLSLAMPRKLNHLKNELLCLNENLEKNVRQRTSELEKTQEKLVETAHKAGMADMARDTVHNIGNIVNSLLVSLQQIDQKEVIGLVDSMTKANKLLRENKDNLESFILEDPNGKKLLDFYLLIEDKAISDQQSLLKIIQRIAEKANEIRNVIKAQHNFLEEAYLIDKYSITKIIDEVLIQQQGLLEAAGVFVEKSYRANPVISLQKPKIVFVISNIISNALKAMAEVPKERKKLVFDVGIKNGHVEIKVIDQGVGIQKENLNRIFRHGFGFESGTNGISLHNSANYIAEMGGLVKAESEGTQMGTVIVINLPLN